MKKIAIARKLASLYSSTKEELKRIFNKLISLDITVLHRYNLKYTLSRSKKEFMTVINL